MTNRSISHLISREQMTKSAFHPSLLRCHLQPHYLQSITLSISGLQLMQQCQVDQNMVDQNDWFLKYYPSSGGVRPKTTPRRM
jgi:hypothetical protein